MAVNGAAKGSSTTTVTPSPTEPQLYTRDTSDDAVQVPLIDTQDDSTRPLWQPRTRAPPPQTTDAAGAPLTADSLMKDALDRFRSRLDSIFGDSALYLARGNTPGQATTLSNDQVHDLARAVEDLLRETPVSKLSPELTAQLEGALADGGMPRDLTHARVKDLGSVGSDAAKRWASNLQGSSPATYYGIGASAAALIGYAGWSAGSDALRSVGLRPQVQSQFFNQRLTVTGGATWDPRFGDVEGRFGADFKVNPNFRLSANAAIDHTGVRSFDANAMYLNGPLAATGQVTMTDGKVAVVSAALTYQEPDFSLSAGALWVPPENRLAAGLEAAWRANDNLSFALSATINHPGDSRVGIGFRGSW